MGAFNDFQHVLNGSSELLISIIVIGVAAYYFLSKDRRSSQPNDYAARSITQPTSYQQCSLETKVLQGHSASRWDIIGHQFTDRQSTTHSAIGGNQDHSLHSDSTSVRKLDSQATAMGNNSTHFPGEMATCVMDETMAPDSTGSTVLATENRRGAWSGTDGMATSTASATDSIATTETTVQDLGSNKGLEIFEPIITIFMDQAHSTMTTTASATSAPSRIKNQQQDGMDGNDSEKRDTSSMVDPIETNDGGEDWMMPQISIDDSSMEATERVNHVASSNSTHGHGQTSGAFENLEKATFYNSNNDESATTLDHKKTDKHDISPAATSTNSAKAPALPSRSSPKRLKRHTKTGISATDHTKGNTGSVSQSKVDGKSKKKNMTALERIEQQRQPYIALCKSRCEFWPRCTNNHCKYYHPFMECRNGKGCKFGKKCVFLHPQDYVDNQYPKRADQAKKKNKTKTKTPSDKLQANQIKSSKKAVE